MILFAHKSLKHVLFFLSGEYNRCLP